MITINKNIQSEILMTTMEEIVLEDSLFRKIDKYIDFTFIYDKVKDLEIMKYIDVLIDGRFILKQFNPNLKWRGSANQRVIDVQETRKQGRIVLHPDSNVVTEFFPEQAFDPCKDMTPKEIKEKYIDNVCNEGQL